MNQFIEWISQPWPWYVAGPMIGLTVPALLILGNKAFGISSSLRHICAACVPAGIPFFTYYLLRHLPGLRVGAHMCSHEALKGFLHLFVGISLSWPYFCIKGGSHDTLPLFWT